MIKTAAQILAEIGDEEDYDDYVNTPLKRGYCSPGRPPGIPRIMKPCPETGCARLEWHHVTDRRPSWHRTTVHYREEGMLVWKTGMTPVPLPEDQGRKMSSGTPEQLNDVLDQLIEIRESLGLDPDKIQVSKLITARAVEDGWHMNVICLQRYAKMLGKALTVDFTLRDRL
jgi:hypothetical protein